tara:strand:+ start:254 stop:2044 length:1791 start_codon:yes stop_codon:yes gene_type:complete
MARYLYDVESDGLLDTITKLHCIVLQDADTGDVFSFKPNEVEEGLKMLMEADQTIAHNGINYDIPAIQKIYPWFKLDESKCFDTLVATRLIWTDLMDRDQSIIAAGKLKARQRGSHALMAWGCRLGVLKGDFGASTDWSEYTDEMLVYCEQDVLVTKKLFELIESKNYSQQSLELEHKIAFILAKQQRHGFLFNVDKANKLNQLLLGEKAEIETQLQTVFLPWYSAVEVKTPKRGIKYKDITRHSTWTGASYTKVKLNTFNASSRAHISNRLSHLYNWKPLDFNKDGSPRIDDEILGSLPYPEAQLISTYLMLQKRLGQLSEGKNSWLNLCGEDSRIHGSVNTNGAVTGRMTHSYPNVAQTPSVGKPYGAECRELYCVPEGKKLVGVDVSGLELRMLGHFLARFDGGEYADEVISGDVHQRNADILGISRSASKTWIYAYLYGSGAANLGALVGKGAKAGAKMKADFLDATPALAQLINGVQKAAEAGSIKGLDGRRIHIRAKFAALNSCLQGAGAIVCKQWAVEMDEMIKAKGYQSKVQVVANIHDEHQYEADEDIAEEVAEMSIEAIKRAGRHFDLRVPLDGDANIGNNWKETH